MERHGSALHCAVQSLTVPRHDPHICFKNSVFINVFQFTNWKRFGRVRDPKWKDSPVTALSCLSKFIKIDICIVAWTMDHCNFGTCNQQVWVNAFMNILMHMTKESRYCVVLSIMSVLRANKISIFNFSLWMWLTNTLSLAAMIAQPRYGLKMGWPNGTFYMSLICIMTQFGIWNWKVKHWSLVVWMELLESSV